MKIFHCDRCGHLAFFENVQCVRCGASLAYLPEFRCIAAMEAGPDGLWRSAFLKATGKTYRLCDNYAKANVCNWTVAATGNPLCGSCRLTRVVPDLRHEENRTAWYRLEVAKRRLVYSLLALGLPLVNRDDDPCQGLTFDFLADSEDSAAPVLTGHAQGVITVNLAEADDAEREKRRVQLKEPYRTLLGHFRHESGHYYWDRLIRNSPRLDSFRTAFGDERQDYVQALARHHDQGPPPDWQQRFVSAYASVHPWEDWAETWAHFLHMVDTLETAAVCGLSLLPHRSDEPRLDKVSAPLLGDFEVMINDWFSLTYVLNNLNRGLGLADCYPFVLSLPAIDKLRWVHGLIGFTGGGKL